MQPLWKALWSYLKKLKMELPYDPAISSGSIFEGTQNTNSKEYMHPYIHCSIIYNTKIWKQPECSSVDEWMKRSVVHDGMLLGHKKEGNFTLCDSMDGPGKHYAK